MLNEVQRLTMAARFRARDGARRDQLNALSAMLEGQGVDPSSIEPLERQQERARLYLQNESFSHNRTPTEGRRILETVVGRDDRLSRSFLTDGVRTANAVCRIATLTNNGEVSFGTGFAIMPGLVLTNNHVLPTPESAARGQVEFGYWSVAPGRAEQRVTLRLEPDNVFLTDMRLDFTIVSFEVHAARVVQEAFGAIDILPRSGKALIGEAVNIIQHGNGEPQSVSLRHNVVVDVFDDWIHYTSDTSPGASGSPVLNDQWQLAALHHAAFEYQTEAGQIVVVNEGTRISSIAKRLEVMIR